MVDAVFRKDILSVMGVGVAYLSFFRDCGIGSIDQIESENDGT
jgi:hypothetical protein